MPFTSCNLDLLKANIVNGEYVMPENLTLACKNLIGGLLATDVHKRFTVDDIFSSIWLGGDVAAAMSSLITGSSSLRISLSCPSQGESTAGSFPSCSCFACAADEDGSCMSAASSSVGIECVDHEILQNLKSIGLPLEGVRFVEEPRNPTLGTYRIFLHKKHSQAWRVWQVKRGKVFSAISCCDGAKRGSDVRDNFGTKVEGNGEVTRRKITELRPRSKFCTIL